MLTTRTAYSWRSDPAVPDFDCTGPLTVMDGECALCSFGARLISRFDRRAEFRICPTQTELGKALLRHFGLKPDDPASWLFISDGRAFTGMDAMIRAGRRVGGVGWLLQPLRLLPFSVQHLLYNWLARNRYRLFGRTQICTIPDPALQKRLIG